MITVFRRSLGAFILGFALSLMSGSAFAAVCDYTCNIQGVMQAISSARSAIVSRIDYMEANVTQAVRAIGEQISANTEKQTAAQKEMTQAQITYQGQLEAQRVTARALENASGSGTPPNACETIEVGQQIGGTAENARYTGKAVARANTNRSTYTQSAAADASEMYKNHSELYCSDIDAKRGRCTVAADPTMQDADIRVDTILAPISGDTLSEKEQAAGKRFIRNVVDPFPTEMLPPSMETTAAGRAYINAQRAEAAQLGVAQYSLSQLLADRTVTAPPGSPPEQQISVLSLMRKFAEDRFTKPEWTTQLATKNDLGVLREIAIILSFKNWVDYRSYLQMQRVEAVLSTSLAINAKAHNAPIINALYKRAQGVVPGR